MAIGIFLGISGDAANRGVEMERVVGEEGRQHAPATRGVAVGDINLYMPQCFSLSLP